MKRSKAIVKLIEIVNEVYTVQNIDSLTEEELGDYFLYEIEKMGMMPPVIDKDFGILYNGDASIERVSAWEDE